MLQGTPQDPGIQNNPDMVFPLSTFTGGRGQGCCWKWSGWTGFNREMWRTGWFLRPCGSCRWNTTGLTQSTFLYVVTVVQPGRRTQWQHVGWTTKHSLQPPSPVLAADIYLHSLCKKPMFFPVAPEERNLYAAAAHGSPQRKSSGQPPQHS